MKMLTRKLMSTSCVLWLSCFAVVANSDSLADRQHDASPIHTWGNADLEMQRIMMMTEVEPTAAGSAPADYDPDGMTDNASHIAGSMHTQEATNNASRYKMEIFGSN